ncbi:unnamed protein product [marine sediment metagenome]|uniref:N-acetyltransferase domain-containing protein n=1 Tax=marine sediment metagenome TaxID=412755 RepID=X0W135_9ZZZZ
MIELVNNEHGYSAVCEYVLVDKEGKHQDKGEYIYIADLEVAERYRKKSIIKQLSIQLMRKYPFLKYVYWEREKHKGKMSFYPVRKLLKEEQNVKMA